MKDLGVVTVPAPTTTIPVVVEIAAGAVAKYEYDKAYGLLVLERFVRIPYPAAYGFVPDTLAGDGDPVDVVVLFGDDLAPGDTLDVVPVGLLKMVDEAGDDDKVLAVPVDVDVTEFSVAYIDAVAEFFATYKIGEPGKFAAVDGFEDAAAAIAAVTDGYAAAYGSGLAA